MKDICRDWGEKASRDTLRLRVETLNILSLPLFLSLFLSFLLTPRPRLTPWLVLILISLFSYTL